MSLIETVRLKGSMRGLLVDPAWKESFPYHLPREQWPILEEVFQKSNLITTPGRLYAYQNGYNFSYIAGGIGSSTPASTDLSLQAEYQRFEVTDLIFTPGQIDAYAEIDPDTGNITWNEWGMILGDGSPTIGSGTMFSRLLYSYTKNLGDTILLNYTLVEDLS